MDGAYIFQIVSIGTLGVFTSWRLLMVLEVQQGGVTTLSDDAAGEGSKKRHCQCSFHQHLY